MIIKRVTENKGIITLLKTLSISKKYELYAKSENNVWYHELGADGNFNNTQLYFILDLIESYFNDGIKFRFEINDIYLFTNEEQSELKRMEMEEVKC